MTAVHDDTDLMRTSTGSIFAKLLEQAHVVTDEAQVALNEADLGTYLADNVAVLFETRTMMMEWLDWCVNRADMEHFHKAEHDTVWSARDESLYNVNFEFLRYKTGTRHATGLPWRVEAMYISGGDSPIHSAFMDRHAQRPGAVPIMAAPVQVSFKVANIQMLGAVNRHLMMNTFWKHSETFVGGYGTYSYFNHREYDWYLKSRVNLRD